MKYHFRISINSNRAQCIIFHCNYSLFRFLCSINIDLKIVSINFWSHLSLLSRSFSLACQCYLHLCKSGTVWTMGICVYIVLHILISDTIRIHVLIYIFWLEHRLHRERRNNRNENYIGCESPFRSVQFTIHIFLLLKNEQMENVMTRNTSSC